MEMETEETMLPVGREQAEGFLRILQKYKAGKHHTEQRIISSENWWKLRNTLEETGSADTGESFRSVSGWLHNVIVSKHADAVESYPEPNILPREEGDREEAQILSAIIPCILEQNEFEQTYSDAMWQKLKTGTACYKVVWDGSKLGGLGDITIQRVNLLNVFWEPGTADIQKSPYFFHIEPENREMLEEMYPQLQGKLRGRSFTAARFLYDDTVSTEDQATVIDVYYRKRVGGRSILHMCKFVEDTVLYATENDPLLSQRGLYDHGLYPYVFDALFPIEGSPCGYGFVDLCRNPQTEIDLLNTAFVKNAMVGATPRFFSRMDGAVNEEELLDLRKPIVHVNGNLGEDSLKQITLRPLDGIYVSVVDRTIQQLRETSGNTETATGNYGSGVTAASAIAALQEAAGKGSRDSTKAAYRAYGRIVNLCIELIRQFYELPRQFRIVGQFGKEQFISYANSRLRAQSQGSAFGQELGSRLPVFDIRVSPQRRSIYTKVSQNELALQFFKLGFFNPALTDQAIACLQMMDFDGRDGIIQKLAGQKDLAKRLQEYQQLAAALADRVDPAMAAGLRADMAGQPMPRGGEITYGRGTAAERRMNRARQQALDAAQPEGAKGGIL